LGIFEAAFAFDRVLMRADILERLPSGGWRLAEVKSTTRVKPEHLHDIAIQAYVISGSGLTVEKMQLVHVDTSYVRGENGIDWHAYFEREDVTAEVRDLLPSVPERVAGMHAILAMPIAPEIRPSGHCFSPFSCEFWDRCTADKPADWVINLPRLKAAMFAELDANGVESMRDIPPDFPLTPGQRRVMDAVVSGLEFISDELPDALIPLGPPASYLDFETFSPAVPLYVGTRPYQRIPFQWSLHHDDGAGDVRHFEFLADGDVDPRREFAETLIEAINRTTGPIIVYSPFEATVLRDLAGLWPDLSERLLGVIDRICDLLPILRTHVTHPEFLGSYSIKAVAPALVPGFTYDDLDGVADGNDASAVFYRLASDRSLRDDDRDHFRRDLFTYCGRDTQALMYVHRRLLAFESPSRHPR
jgi:predicted RecB family nuclease